MSELLERQLLGCMLKDNTLIEETNLTSDMLAVEAHQVIFTEMCKIYATGKVVDQVTIIANTYAKLEALGGISFINGLKTDGDPAHFDSYQQTFFEEYRKASAQKILQSYLASSNKDINRLMINLEKIIDQGTREEPSVQEVLMELYEEPYLEQASENMIPTGLKDLDRLILGFEKQTSTIIGGRPSMGKTALMLKLAKGAIAHDCIPIIFSLEMSKKKLLRRLISSEATINGMLTKRAKHLTDHQKKSWSEAIGRIDSFNLEIFDHSLKTIQEMRSDIRKVKKKYPGKECIVFIDYLTKIQTKQHFQSEHLRVTEISNQLKAMAKDYDLPVVTLAQLSRNVEQRQNKRPNMADLRESGSIEQDADLIMFVYRDDYYNEESEKANILELIIAKSRDGAIGTVEVAYNRAINLIKDLEARDDEVG
ncbi:DnaB-like helicase C-terminal domain-containing protein [Gracilibacillus sp. S3-1-1]|uniref:DnaB-like helicase C-terminal domain-containing protein n=1 Tax=Gracilibacillus pellucidus TaxID=3095368 RepID=A0ACC6M9Y1_9BACI|nr:DnaB-like helicase C-terminal domain-containing protein [Gracilibacillus sp. S3-1-1]MDX8047592.1 DnaB-like helicase C-terminal domain-containing protein [Gracilibacillus sp. S3-1-1]